MEHVVFFPTSDGAPAFRRVSSIEDAVCLVEHLRNVEGVPEVSVHALTEVPLSFRPWFRVELPGSGLEQAAAPEQPFASEPASALEPTPASAPEPTPTLEPEPVIAVVPVQSEAAPSPVEPVAVEQVSAEPMAVLTPSADPEPEPVAVGNGHVGGGPKSLGFFA